MCLFNWNCLNQVSDIILHHSHFSKFIMQIVAVNWKNSIKNQTRQTEAKNPVTSITMSGLLVSDCIGGISAVSVSLKCSYGL